MPSTRKQKTKKRATRKHRGGMSMEQFSAINRLTGSLTKESIESALGLCTTYILNGNYGTILKACFKTKGDCRPPCFAIKYVPETPESNSLALKFQYDVLAHESHMMYLITKSLEHSTSELPNHIEKYLGSIVPNTTTPWLFTEYITGVTLASSGISKNISTNLVSLYLETLLVLNALSEILPGFVHGDLNPGNIFLVRRSTKHPSCRYDIVSSYNNDGNPTIEEYTFSEPYMIKLIDFGFAECDTYKWQSHPASAVSIAGLWQLDAYMALATFYSVALEQQDKFINICQDFFGEQLTAALNDKEFDIYKNYHLFNKSEKTELYAIVKTYI